MPKVVTEEPVSSQQWKTIITGLRQQKTAIEDRLGKLEGERRSLLVPSGTGDRSAGKRLAEVTDELDKRRVELADCRDTITEAEGKLREAEASEDLARRRERAGEVRKAAAAILAADKRADAAMQELTAALIDRARAIREVMQHHGPAHGLNDLLLSPRIERAGEAHRLTDFFRFGRWPGSREHLKPLADIDAGALERFCRLEETPKRAA